MSFIVQGDRGVVKRSSGQDGATLVLHLVCLLLLMPSVTICQKVREVRALSNRFGGNEAGTVTSCYYFTDAVTTLAGIE
jgi:hypothetical protein